MKANLKKHKKVLIVGHYGSGNYGDDIMLQYLLNEYRVTYSSVKVVFFDRYSLGVDIEEDQIIYINRRDKFSMLKTLIKSLLAVDLVIWGGGTCFTDEEGDGFFWGMIIAKLLGKDIFYRSIGLGNLKRVSRILKAKFLLSLSSGATLRDESSLSKVRSLVSQKNHPKFSYENDLGDLYLKKQKEEFFLRNFSYVDYVDYVVLAWRDLDAYQAPPPLALVIEYISSLARKDKKRIVIIDTDNVVDRKIGEYFLTELSKYTDLDISRPENLSFDEKSFLISKADSVITSRLHVGIAAVVFERDLKIYAYSPKINYAFKDDCSLVEFIFKEYAA